MTGYAGVLALFESLPGAQFAGFVYTAKGSGEVARHNVILGAVMANVYKKDIAALEAVRASLTDALEVQACDAILASRRESLDKWAQGEFNDKYTCADTYVSLPMFPGVKVHKETGVLYVTCITNGKTVLTPGTYKAVNSKPLTLAKNRLMRAHCRGDKIRTYRFTNLRTVKVAGDVLEIDGDVEVDF